MSSSLDSWKLLVGLGIILFGMLLIEASVKALSGRTFRRIIRTYTNGQLRAIGSGAPVTALLQSSSLPSSDSRIAQAVDEHTCCGFDGRAGPLQ